MATSSNGRLSGLPERQNVLALSRDELLNLAKSYSWVHTIDLGGFTTPGKWGRGNPEIARAFDQIDFQGKRVLDVGCWDGQWTFEAESRGASDIVATDLISQRRLAEQRTFEVAAALRGSKARYISNLSVYDVETLGQHFDVVLYMGVYYHLKDPLRSFTVLRRIMDSKARILIEGAVLVQPGCFANFYYERQFCDDNSNWWVPTQDCLRQWIRCSFLDIEWEGVRNGHLENQRACIVAKAVQRVDPLYLRIPEGLENFNS